MTKIISSMALSTDYKCQEYEELKDYTYIKNSKFIFQNKLSWAATVIVQNLFKKINFDEKEIENVGILVNVGNVMEAFQDEFINYIKKRCVKSPTKFLNTAENLISGIIAITFGIHGFNVSISDNNVQNGVIIAESLIANKECKYVVLLNISSQIEKNNNLEKDIVNIFSQLFCDC